MALQRPLTREEFVIQSLLTSREPLVTLVDVQDDDPTMPMERPDAIEAERPPTRRRLIRRR